MVVISLIVPLPGNRSLTFDGFEHYRRVLLDQPGISSVEIIIAGELPVETESCNHSCQTVQVSGKGSIGCLQAGLEAASGDLVLVLDPDRAYSSEALARVVAELQSGETDLAIGVPERSGETSTTRSLGRAVLGLVSRLSLGTADAFSGLLALDRRRLGREATAHYPQGTRLALHLLASPGTSHCDVPVPTLPQDRLRILPLRLDDLRQLKRVLDLRFGTFSRLVQFCMVGASGMIVDLTLYALLQLLFAKLWPQPGSIFSSSLPWTLASARALAIFAALGWNFTLNRRLTFNDSRQGSIVRQFLTYGLGNALGIAVSLFLSLALPLRFRFFSDHRLAAAVVGIVFATGISFSMSRWVVFIRRSDVGAGTPAEHAPLTV